MKTFRTHPTAAKKMYRRPMLNQLGSIEQLTKGKLGSSFDGGFDPAKYDGKTEQ
ncbi:hypothetical protein [Dyadobacter bucti]|uniref:hypothetical protein n=1 Tax=Dyadobacter bucti TaxID=2572203 RepID=UPI0014073B7B|nr:hypothetical protein [Dyadobacter bucti]